MTQKDIVIFGAGGMAQTVHALLQADGAARVAAFTVDRDHLAGTQYDGRPLLPFDELARHFPPAQCDLLIAIGQIDRNRARARVFDAARAAGYALRSYIDPKVRVHASTQLGHGCLIFDGVSLQPYTRIGDNAVIRPLAYIGHHATVEAHAFIAPHAALLGRSHIGTLAFIGAHATVSSHVRIGAASIVGAGAVVLRDIPPRSVVRPAAR